jgi:microcompartment protein CcmL/EutN
VDKSLALGMIETIGLTGLIAAADAAAKAADVKLIRYEGADAGIITLYVVGDVSSVQAAVAAGEVEAKRVGQLRHTHVIPRPDESVNLLVQKLLKKTGAAPLSGDDQENLEQRLAPLKRKT